MEHIVAVLYLIARMMTPWNVVGHQALEEVNWEWRPADWNIEFQPGREKYLGMTYMNQKKVVIWVRLDRSPEQVAGDIVHELTHVFSETYLDKSRQQKWMRTRGFPRKTPWSTAPVGKNTKEK